MSLLVIVLILTAMTSDLLAMASNLIAMASNLIQGCLDSSGFLLETAARRSNHCQAIVAQPPLALWKGQCLANGLTKRQRKQNKRNQRQSEISDKP